jgi:restriction system protein
VLLRVYNFFKAQRWLDGIEMQQIDQMSGLEFERACAEIFRRSGYAVTHTKQTGDQGADLILDRRSERSIVQAKRWSSTVGNGAVQEIVAAKAMYKANRAIVITNNFFTAAARVLATANAVELLDRSDLAKMLARTRRIRPASDANADVANFMEGARATPVNGDAHPVETPPNW